jgi:hypothetical protein
MNELRGFQLKARRLWHSVEVLDMALERIEDLIANDPSIANTVGEKHELETIPNAKRMLRSLREVALRIDRTVAAESPDCLGCGECIRCISRLIAFEEAK